MVVAHNGGTRWWHGSEIVGCGGMVMVWWWYVAMQWCRDGGTVELAVAALCGMVVVHFGATVARMNLDTCWNEFDINGLVRMWNLWV